MSYDVSNFMFSEEEDEGQIHTYLYSRKMSDNHTFQGKTLNAIARKF
jgi:hypothetical protein